MADLTVSITASLPEYIDAEHTEVVTVPPDYKAIDVNQLIAVTVENIGWHLLVKERRYAPIREAFLANDARVVRLQELIDSAEADGVEPTLRERLREIFMVSAAEAVRRWGEPQIGD